MELLLLYTTSHRTCCSRRRRQQKRPTVRQWWSWLVVMMVLTSFHYIIIMKHSVDHNDFHHEKSHHHNHHHFMVHGFVVHDSYTFLSKTRFGHQCQEISSLCQRIVPHYITFYSTIRKDNDDLLNDNDDVTRIVLTTSPKIQSEKLPPELILVDSSNNPNTVDNDDDDDDDFSAWIVSNLKQWPLLNNNNNNNNNNNMDISSSSSSSSQQQQQQQPLQQSSPLIIINNDQVVTPLITTTVTTTMLDNNNNNNNNNTSATTTSDSSSSSSSKSSNNNNNVWNDVGTLLLQSTISPSIFSFVGNNNINNTSLSSNTTTTSTSITTITSYLRSPLSQVFNVEGILPLLSSSQPTPTTKGIDIENVTNDPITINSNNTVTKATISGSTSSTTTASPSLADSIIKQATARIEAIVTEASTVVSSDTVTALINKASELVRLSSTTTTTTTASAPLTSSSTTTLPRATSTLPTVVVDDNQNMNTKIESLPPSIVRESLTTYASSILRVADGLLRKGYVDGDIIAKKLLKRQDTILQNLPIISDSQALFNEYRSVREINTFSNELMKSTEMGALAGAVYEGTISRTHALRQAIVARGTSADVTWMISDCIANHTSFTTKMDTASRQESFLVRTITIRGFDASDESVDREKLLNLICTATPVQIWNNSSQQQQQLQGIFVHEGLLSIARAIYVDIKKYVDWTASSQKIVLNGHSIGGSIAILLLMLMIQDYGIEFVRKQIIQVYTFGSPPVTVMRDPKMNVLSVLDVPTSLIQGFVQPWDPIVRLFTDIDALYPLVSDLGPDDITPFANGPPRALRPLLKSILVAWAGWPRFRDNYRGTARQSYTSVGVQHIILPEPTRYLADRFLAVNIPVPPIETIVQISSDELYSALSTIFPLDVFEVSYVPQAIRSFVHHFYPAYGFPLVDYVKELQRRSRGLPERKSEFAFSEDDAPSSITTSSNDGGIDWGKATQWLTRSDTKL